MLEFQKLDLSKLDFSKVMNVSTPSISSNFTQKLKNDTLKKARSYETPISRKNNKSFFKY